MTRFCNVALMYFLMNPVDRWNNPIHHHPLHLSRRLNTLLFLLLHLFNLLLLLTLNQLIRSLQTSTNSLANTFQNVIQRSSPTL